MDQPAFLGIIMLDTDFPRLAGDVGNPDTFDFPVRHEVVPGASVEQIVIDGRPNESLCKKFVDTAQNLEKQGAVGLVTSCGFLSVIQNDLAKAVNIPVISSVLMLVPLISASIGNTSVGIVSADSTKLSSSALTSAGIDPNQVHIIGMEHSPQFNNLIYQPKNFSKHKLANEFEAAVELLLTEQPQISALVLECTNLQPYAQHVIDNFNLPVYGIVQAANLIWQGYQSKY